MKAEEKELLRFFDDPNAIPGITIPLFKPGFRMVIFSLLLMVVVLFFKKGLLGGRELNFGEIFKAIDKKRGGVNNG